MNKIKRKKLSQIKKKKMSQIKIKKIFLKQKKINKFYRWSLN